jgi:hypothetical protein
MVKELLFRWACAVISTGVILFWTFSAVLRVEFVYVKMSNSKRVSSDSLRISMPLLMRRIIKYLQFLAEDAAILVIISRPRNIMVIFKQHLQLRKLLHF